MVKLNSKEKYFVTGIDTEIGKTIVSTILVEALKADYWKPIQSGDLNNSDTMKVKELISNSSTKFHPETYRLKTPASPDYSAAIDGITIDKSNFNLPKTDNSLIVEGAGGLMVPLNDEFLIIDLIAQLKIPIILVSKNYLGSINHTILSIKAIQERGIPLAGIIFNGEKNEASEKAILKHTKIEKLFSIPKLEVINKVNIEKMAKKITEFIE